MIPSYVLPLSDAAASLETVGGKGLSLAKMAQEGLPVPTGFHITTAAYRLFVTANGLQPQILTALERVDTVRPASAEAASAAIGEFFIAAAMPPAVEGAIREAYCHLQAPIADSTAPVSVAVRSSATAEDLPGASFAGQQETYLNIHGEREVLEAVKKCWASLWTGRAIVYRLKNKIDQNAVALAVVVQEMVPAESAGILFTANPMTGRRDEIVINAAWGLGEAIVGGLVTPDSIIVNKSSGKVKKMDVAEKAVITVMTANGTTQQPLNDSRRTAPVLKEAQVTELVTIARKIEDFYGAPQDIEWCQKDGQFFVVQSRPITTLPPAEIAAPLEWKLPKGAYAAMRNNIVELMADPLSPLFATLGLSAVNTSLHRLMNDGFGMGGIMPPEIIVVVNQYAYFNGSVSAKSVFRMTFGAGKILKQMFTGAVERWTETGRPRYFETVATWQAKNWRAFSSIELLRSARLLSEAAIDAYGALISGVIPAAWMTEALFTKVYNSLIQDKGDPAAPIYLLGYNSLPIQADKSLYSLAEWARGNPALAQALQTRPAAQLALDLKENDRKPENVPSELWAEWQQRFRAHLQQFGHTLYDLDFAQPVPADDPAPVLDAFKLYLSGQGVNPHHRQDEAAKRREQAVQAKQASLKGLRLKWFNKFLAPAQRYAPLREDGLAEIGLAYPLLRQMLLEVGRRFVKDGVIVEAGDIFWLTQSEAQRIAERVDSQQPAEPLAAVVVQRKLERQAALRAHPPMALPQMKVFGFDLMSLKAKKRGRGDKGNLIQGVAASPGKVTGTARVLHGPADFGRMQPGDVLVAPITTPAWTPLFAMAAAVVTDVGGPLSHGSIVAREYGIPAVLGTGIATRRIQDGQTITVDGSTGTILLRAG